MSKLIWHTEKRKISDLVLFEGNPRMMSKKQAEDLMKSLKKFDVVEIPVVDQNNRIIAGNMRVAALRKLGRDTEEIEVRVPSRELTEEEAREYLLRSNRNTGSWDEDLLLNFDVDMLLDVGWEQEEIDFIAQIDDTMMGGEDSFDIDNALEKEPEFKVERGDLFEIGNHKLLCGDSTQRVDIERLMHGKKADMMFTDPPYGINYGEKNRLLNSFAKSRRITKDIANDMLGKDELLDMLVKAFTLAGEFGQSHCSYYVTAPMGGELGLVMMMMMMSGLPIKHVLIWNKNKQGFSLGRLDYEYKHEPILYTWKEKHIFYGNGQFKNSVWDIAKEQKCDKHPTMKPIALMENALLNSSKADDLCIDFFLGSGSTMVACHQTRRRCFGVELDPIYCSVILERMIMLDNTLEIKKNGVLL